MARRLKNARVLSAHSGRPTAAAVGDTQILRLIASTTADSKTTWLDKKTRLPTAPPSEKLASLSSQVEQLRTSMAAESPRLAEVSAAGASDAMEERMNSLEKSAWDERLEIEARLGLLESAMQMRPPEPEPQTHGDPADGLADGSAGDTVTVQGGGYTAQTEAPA